MNSFLTNLHTDLRSVRRTRRGSTHHPSAVPRGIHKAYERMDRVLLDDIEATLPLSDAFVQRRSALTTAHAAPLSIADLSLALSGLRRHNDSKRRRYPSGGGLFPIETYLVATTLHDTAAGVFHYNPTRHALERLWDTPDEFAMSDLAPKPAAPPLATVLLFTSVWERSSAKYGDFTYMLALLEAGHMSENVLLACAASGIRSRPVIGFMDSVATSLLDLDECEEQPVLSIILCKEGSDQVGA